jgi:hypothetical protein
MCMAAASGRLDPDRISFTTALHAIRRTLPAARTSPDTALAQVETEITAALVPERHGRVCPRAVAEPRPSPFPSRRTSKEPISQHAHYTITISYPARSAPASPHQPKQTPAQANQPP